MSTSRVGTGRVRTGRVRAGRVLGYVTLVVLSTVSAFPLVWMLITSVRPRNTLFGGGFLPDQLTFASYREAWSGLDFPRHFLISLVITAITVVGVVALATLAGYAFAHLEFRGKQVIYVTLLSTIMLPVTAIVIPLFLELDALGLLDSRTGLVLVYIGTSVPFGMFLMRVFFETLPHELVQAARVDGAGEFTIFARVMLPLAAPGAATVVIFQFMNTWNEFLFAQTFLRSPEQLPLQPVLYGVVGAHSTDWPLLCASLTMSIVPIIMVYMRMQRRFVAGMTLGAVKN
jgi:ABC-type glycerol-3-phosphate transport system permease component